MPESTPPSRHESVTRTLRSACLLSFSEFHSGAPVPECAPLSSEPLSNLLLTRPKHHCDSPRSLDIRISLHLLSFQVVAAAGCGIAATSGEACQGKIESSSFEQ